MLSPATLCSPGEWQSLLPQLNGDAAFGPQIALALQSGQAQAWRQIVGPTAVIGKLRHCWYSIEGPAERLPPGTPRLFVVESLRHFQDRRTNDSRSHVQRIEERLRDLKSGRTVGTTILRRELRWGYGEWVVVDGNHSVAAKFNNAQRVGDRDLQIPVYYILPSGVQVPRDPWDEG